MKKFKQGDWVTPKETSNPDRRLVYYHYYYRSGVYGEQFRGKRIEMEPGMAGRVRAVCPSVRTSALHEEFLCIEFFHPVTGKTEKAGLHHSEVVSADPIVCSAR